MLALVSAALILPGEIGNATAGQRFRLLLVSSYHPGFPTFFEQIQGIKSITDQADVLLDVEYMDTKRFNDETNRANFLQSLRYKLDHSPSYNAVMTADDNAFEFALEHQNDLFKDLPIIFFGVNNVPKALEQNDNPMVTGVVEAVSMKDTIALMLRLHPKVKTIVALVDDTPSGQGDLKTFEALASNFKGVSFKELSLAQMSFAQFKRRLSGLGDDTAVLLLSAYRDNKGKVLQFHQAMELITANLSRPLYHLWHHGMGDGVLGGKIISHYDQGRCAAEMALQVMRGASPASLPVNRHSPNRYYFDYKQLRRFGVGESMLPADRVVINKPRSFYEEYKAQVIWLSLLFVALVAVVVFLSLNVIQRKSAQEKLRESEGRFRSTFEQAAMGFFHLGLDGQFLRVNHRFCSMLGYGPEQLHRMQLSDVTYDDDIDETISMMGRLLSGSTDTVAREGRYRKQDNGLMWGNLTFSLRLTDDNKPLYYIGVLEDIGERKSAERDRENLEARLRQSQKMEALGTLAGGVAHDFNNLLAAILGYAELAQDAAQNKEDCIPDIQKLIESAERGRELVRQILTFSRKVQAKLKPLDLNEEVQRVTEMLKRTLPKMINVETNLEPGLWAIAADQTQIEQVLLNLAGNAADVMQTGGTLSISTRNMIMDEADSLLYADLQPGDYVQLEVADNGSGMDSATLEQIFDPFFTTKEIGKGTGLGLSTVFGVVKKHHGSITCTSEPGEGTIFSILIPAYTGLDNREQIPLNEAPRTLQRGHRVLFVDDEQALCEIAAVNLTRAGYKVITADNGELALQMYESDAGNIDLVILDLSMPGQGGIACLKGILEIDPEARVLVSSGYCEGAQISEVMAAGARGYLPKPTSKSNLLAAVCKALDD